MSSMTGHILGRFFRKIKTVGDHELWTGAISSSGYGSFYFDGGRSCRKIMSAHVFAYEFYYGKEVRYEVHHTCKIKLCCKKEHLQDVTRREHNGIHNDKKTPVWERSKNI